MATTARPCSASPPSARRHPPMVLDGEIAVPEDRGLTHIDGLSEAISERHGTTMRSSATSASCSAGAALRRYRRRHAMILTALATIAKERRPLPCERPQV